MNKLGIPLLCLAVVLATGCRQHRWYDYENWDEEVFGGKLQVVLRAGEENTYTENGRRYADWRGDYFLSFGFYAPYEYDLAGILIKDIKMLGEESGTEVHLPDLMSNLVMKRHTPRRGDASEHPGWWVSTTASQRLVNVFNDLPYEPYSLTFTLIVYGGDASVSEETFFIKMKTDFRRIWLSDILLVFLSV